MNEKDLSKIIYINNVMRNVPFVENSKDDSHCVNAVFRMVYKYFFKTDLSWQKIDKITKAIPGKGTWTFIGEMEFAKLGLRITNIEPIDYQILYKKGTIYLQEIFSKQTADYYIFQSNIESVIKYIPEYLKVVKHETRKASVKEIKEYIQEEALIGVELNSRILNDRDDLSLHFVLIYDLDDHGFFIHDPGLPPIKARYVLFDKFDKAFNFKGSNAAVVVFEEHKNNNNKIPFIG